MKKMLRAAICAALTFSAFATLVASAAVGSDPAAAKWVAAYGGGLVASFVALIATY
jgi:hypothetical protein